MKQTLTEDHWKNYSRRNHRTITEARVIGNTIFNIFFLLGRSGTNELGSEDTEAICRGGEECYELLSLSKNLNDYKLLLNLESQ